MRKAAYDTVQRELVENPGYVYLTHIDHLYAVGDGVEDTLRVIATLIADLPNPEGPAFDSRRVRFASRSRRHP